MAAEDKIDWENPPDHPLSDSESLLEWMTKVYDQEHERKDRITSSLALPAGVVVGVFGAVVYYSTLLVQAKQNGWSIALLTIEIALAICLCITFIALLAAYFEREYSYTVPPSEFILTILKFTEAQGHENLEDSQLKVQVESDVRRWLINHLAESAEITREANESRLNCIRWAKWALAGTLIFLTISLPPAIIVKRDNLEVSHKYTALQGVTKADGGTREAADPETSKETGADTTARKRAGTETRSQERKR